MQIKHVFAHQLPFIHEFYVSNAYGPAIYIALNAPARNNPNLMTIGQFFKTT
jgi:hypothetical protein